MFLKPAWAGLWDKMQSQISSICISYLTQLLDLNALDELLDVERESFVLTNIRSEFGSRSCEDDILDADRREKKSHKKLFKSNSKGINFASLMFVF